MFFFEPISLSTACVVIGMLIALIALNELARLDRWVSVAMFIGLPLVLTVTVWPTTAAGAGWFPWVKTYSALAGAVGFMAIRFIPGLEKNRAALCFPALILAVNIAEAVAREFQISMDPSSVDALGNAPGPWNTINAVAGIINILTITGWFGIILSKDKKRDMVWPDMLWFWILAYDLWNMTYVYNTLRDGAIYAGFSLLLACTIPAFMIKKGAWLQHRAQTLALFMMFWQTFPSFATDPRFIVVSTATPQAHYTLSILSLVVNIAVGLHQLAIVLKRNRVGEELYTEHSEYKQIAAENR
jgi:hypothetical protein